MIPQLWHVGAIRRLGMAPDPLIPGLGPREIRVAEDVVVRALGAHDAARIAESYAASARMAREIGFDGIALHGAHGYLLDQFLWPATNDRVDEYGGDLTRRCRLAREVVEAIRAAVGPHFPIVFRFSQWKMNDYGGRIVDTREDLARLLSELVEAGIDVFDVSTRRFWEPAFGDATSSLAALTRTLSGKPTIAVGSVGLDQPHQSKFYRATTSIDANVVNLDNVVTAYSAGDFDLVAVGRAILADPIGCARCAAVACMKSIHSAATVWIHTSSSVVACPWAKPAIDGFAGINLLECFPSCEFVRVRLRFAKQQRESSPVAKGRCGVFPRRNDGDPPGTCP